MKSLASLIFTAFLAHTIALSALAQSPLPDSLNPVANSSVLSLAVQADGGILAGGNFTTLGGQSRNHIGRLNAGGTLDTSFNPGPDYQALSLAVQADGRILLGGYFSTLGGQSRAYIGRLNADGTLDTTFDPGADGIVHSVAVQADRKILVGGSFSTLGGQSHSYIGRLNADGTPDMSFDPGADGAVISLAVQADGKILVGGTFTMLGGQSRNLIGRLNADGTLDPDFNPGASATSYPYVFSLAVQADGRILVGGNFTTLGGQSRDHIGRLNADGTLDTTFNPGAGGTANPNVYSLALQADGRILVGGSFSTLGGQSRSSIGRLNADGTLDPTFNPGAGGTADPNVYSLAVQADGKVLAGGLFTTLGGQSRTNLGRLGNTGPATQSLAFDGSTLTWTRGGASPEVWRTTFEYSPDGNSWTDLGAGIRIPRGWQLTGLVRPTNTIFRARGYTTGGYDNGSGWFVETVLRPALAISGPYSANAQFGFNANGPAGQRVVIEASPDLTNWTPLQTNILGAGPLPFSDPQPARLPSRFYRLRSTL